MADHPSRRPPSKISATRTTPSGTSPLLDYSGTNACYASTSYQYDGLYRLTRASTTLATTTNWLETYAYDTLGNLTNKSNVGSYSYAGTGFANPHAATTINGVNYSYDTAGNLTSAGSMAIAWDPWNRLSYTSHAGTTTGYIYDHYGGRVTQGVDKGSGTTTTTYFSKYYEKTGATTTLYVFLPSGELLATIEGNGSATSTYIAHTDHLNSSSVLSDKNGALAQLSTYYPFGSIRSNDEPSSGFDEKRKYIGQYYDDATALSYLNARYYDGMRGQFASQDPAVTTLDLSLLSDPHQLNTYAYGRNNPLTYRDADGRKSEIVFRPIYFEYDRTGIAGVHSFILITPDSGTLQLKGYEGASKITIGGYSNGSQLVTEINRPRDFDLSEDKYISRATLPVPDAVVLAEGQKLVQQTRTDQTKTGYSLFGQPQLYGQGNCNNVSTQILFNSGVSSKFISSIDPGSYRTAGLGKPINSPTISQSVSDYFQMRINQIQSAIDQLKAQRTAGPGLMYTNGGR